MNQKDLIAAIQARAISLREGQHINKADIEAVLTALGNAAAHALANGGEVPLPGLGKLVPEDVDAREGRNPATGEAIQIPAKTVAKFRAAKALKDALNP